MEDQLAELEVNLCKSLWIHAQQNVLWKLSELWRN